MESKRLEGVNGWLLVYLVGSIPLLMLYSMGLSGWLFDYPVGLMVAIFVVLALPLGLVLSRSPRAPRWNIAQLWIVAVLMFLRAASVFLFPMQGEEDLPIPPQELPLVIVALTTIVSLALAWAIVWTLYFKRSVRVRETLGAS